MNSKIRIPQKLPFLAAAGAMLYLMIGCENITNTMSTATQSDSNSSTNDTSANAAEVSDVVFVQKPKLVQNPSGRVPLAAEISFKAAGNIKTDVTVSDGTTSWPVPSSAITQNGNAYSIPLVGMKADRDYEIRLSILQNGESVFENTFSSQNACLAG